MNNFPKFGNGGGLLGTLPKKGSLKIGGLPEALQNKPQITIVTGFLGAGKTTLITGMFPYLPKETRMIINDIGAFNVDAERLKSDDTVALQDSCICCGSFDELIHNIEGFNGGHILIEPTGIATPESLLSYFQEKGYEVSVITVINTDNFGEQIGDELMSTTLISQIRAANILAVRGDEQNQEEFQKWLEKFGIENTPQTVLPDTRGGVERLPGQERDFYEQFWKKVESVRGKVAIDIELIIRGHFSGSSSEHKGVDISDVGLQEYISYLDKQDITVIRAKGINGEGGFDYVPGRYKESSELGFPHFVIITDTPLNKTQIDALQFYQNKYPIMQNKGAEIPDFEESSQRVQRLVDQYRRYMEMYTQKQEFVKELESLQVSQDEQESLTRAINTLDFQLQKLGDDMKFDNPWIWIAYKKQAYDGTDAEIADVQAFRNHCAIDDPKSRYICKKRFLFLNQTLKERYGIDLATDTDELHGAAVLSEILALPALEELSQDEEFMKEWLQYEYFERGGKTMKWENYSS